MRPKLREPNQFICEALAAYLELQSGTAVIDETLVALKIDPPDQTEDELINMIAQADQDKSCAFVCVQSLEKASPALHKYIVDWLNRRIGTLQDLIELPISHF